MAKKIRLSIKFCLIVIGIWTLYVLQNSKVNDLSLFTFIPIMFFSWMLLRYFDKNWILNIYICYITSTILALITVAKIVVDSGIPITLRIIIESVISIIGLTILFQLSIQSFLTLINKIKISQSISGISWKTSFFIIFLGWIVYLIPFLPGNVAGDGNFQLMQFFGRIPMTNHHPFLSTFFEGSLISLGSKIGGSNFGLFLYVAVQLLICCLIYSYCISKISKYGISKKISLGVTIIVSIAPYWSFASETLHKDGLFLAFFALYVISLISIILTLTISHGHLTFKMISLFLVSALLVSFWRNDGIYMITPSMFCLVFIENKKYWKRFTAAFVIFLSIFIIFNKAILPAIHVSPTETREALSLPVQQTALY